MRGVNKVILIGNIGKEPEVQTIEGNIPVAKFPLATTEMRKERNGNQVSETTWHNVVLWRGLAELTEKYLHKGSLVYIEGKLRNRSYEDKDKIKRFYTEIVAENLVMLDKRKETKVDEDTDNTAFNSEPNTDTNDFNPFDKDDDLML